ncbi:transporter, partial [Psychromonas arctica]
DFIIAIILTIGLNIAFAGTIEGRLEKKLSFPGRAMLLVSGFTMLVPFLYINIAGIVVIVVLTLNYYRLS